MPSDSSKEQCSSDVRSIWNSIADAPVLKAGSLYAALHVIAAAAVRHKLDPSSLSRSDRIFLAEKLPSTVSAFLTAVPSIVLHSRLPWRNDLITPYPRLLDRILAQHIGYTLYDLAIMAYAGGQHPTAWIHHILGILGTALMRHYRTAAYFPAVFLPTEITVVSTNFLWILQKLGKDDGKAFSWALVLRAILFCLVRAPAGTIGLIYALRVVRRQKAAAEAKNSVTASSQAEVQPQRATTPGTLWQQLRQTPTVVWSLTTINVLSFTALNFYWTKLVLVAVKRHRHRGRVHHI
ncbi:hypothetical protein BDZ88DRAFT_49446 [Geranomyces variabilis]|nr:hypothetical protein BDZ88DRAFT_49446 [Geranomyces variabilis]KAJ3136585.1 hypothetical protein HDU90_002961 [Geranomyces variabilis]